MSTVVQHAPLVSPDDYLLGETSAANKHEYLNGTVYSMAGRTARHSAICVRLLGLLYSRLRGTGSQPFNSDLLLRIKTGADLRFYYPDAMIHCGSLDSDARVIDNPSVVFEILSESTERIDTGEKRMAYLTIPSLEAYVIVDPDVREVTVWRQQAGQWAPQRYTASDAALEFASASCALTVGEIYEGTGL
jgi:Uma2 family endonuclease